MNVVTPPPLQLEETEEQRKSRQLNMLRESAEWGMMLARKHATEALEAPPAEPDAPAPKAPDPTLAFSRATRAVRQAIQLECQVVAGAFAPKAAPAARPPLPPDARRAPLREELYKLTNAEPDRATRAELRRDIDARIEDELLADRGGQLAPADLMEGICADLGLPFDPKRFSDEFLGMGTPAWPNPTWFSDTAPPGSERPPPDG